MFTEHIAHLVCPTCKTPLTFDAASDARARKIETGTLRCATCDTTYPIVRGVPRFVPNDHYTKAFGYQWLQHAKTQYDSYIGMPVTENRIRRETKWPEILPGEKILEVGSGSGRYTEQLIKKQAFIASFDASVAVEANYASHGNTPNVLIIQADLHALPFRDGYFDRVACFGVLQHTPHPKVSIEYIVAKVRKGGHCVMDIYNRHSWYRQMWNTRYWARPFVRGMDPQKLYTLCEKYVTFMWPFARRVTKLPFGRTINHKLLIPELMTSKGKYGKFSNELHLEWTILHLFDWLNPTYDQPQYIETFHRWLLEAGLTNVETNFGYGGIEGRGVRG